MKPAPFRYASPVSVDEALELLTVEDARPLAGGQSLVPMLNFRLARPELLVDLNPLAALAGIENRSGRLWIGAMTRQAALLDSDIVAAGWPLLQRAVAHVGHPAIRNRGTVGGSVAHADPAAELPVVLAALDARLHVRSAGAHRTLSTSEFFRGPLVTALQDGELLTGIEVPPVPAGARTAFVEHARTHGDFALAGVAAVHVPGRHAALGLLGAGPIPVRATDAERALAAGATLDEVAALAGALARDDYRQALIAALVGRALRTATA